MRRRLVPALVLATLLPACSPAADARPDCVGGPSLLILATQAVPSATLVPCVETLPTGWDYSGSFVRNGRFEFSLDSDRAGMRAATVELVARCDTSDAVEVAPGIDEAGTRRFEEPISLVPAYAANRYYTFPGGCVIVAYRFQPGADAQLALEADLALGFRERQEAVEYLEGLGLVLCGAGAPPCPGGD